MTTTTKTNNKRAIGIDLGTSFSCIGVVQDDKVNIISNDGNRTTPSYVAFTDTEILIGQAAKAQASINPLNTIFNAKRLIGRRFMEYELQQDMKHWPFGVIEEDSRPKFEVKSCGQTKRYTAEQISAMILGKLKSVAERYLGEEVDKAVITVAASFNDAQRQATKDAGEIAGLNVLRVINEPTAAAIAYALDKKCEDEEYILVFDLGGGTVDVSLLYRVDDFLEVKATCGDTHLGGEDFDNNLVDYFIDEFKRKHKKDITVNPKSLRRLRTACEQAKRILSTATHTTIQIDSLFEDIDFVSQLSRTLFEELNSDLFKKTFASVEQVLKDAEIRKSEVAEIVLVGGSTRIPKIQELLSEYFDGKKLNNSLDPDEAVAYGAAIQAALLTGTLGNSFDRIHLVDINSHSLGIEVAGGLMDVIIKRNTSVPAVAIKRCSTSKDNQSFLNINIYEGERSICKKNYFLGRFRLTGLPRAPRGMLKIKVQFEIDQDGILTVLAVEGTRNKTVTITIAKDRGNLTKEEIEKMVKEAEEYKKLDEVASLKIVVRNDLDRFKVRIQNLLKGHQENQKFSPDDVERLEELLTQTNNDARTLEECKIFLEEANAEADKIFDKYKF